MLSLGVLTLAAATMLHIYTDVVGFCGGFPIPILVGLSETGKSLSSNCALAIFGQHNAGHIMKTKSTSNIICFERCTQSSLPFVLDDPKNADDIGEMLINFVMAVVQVNQN